MQTVWRKGISAMEFNIQILIYGMLFLFLGSAAYYDIRWKSIPWTILGTGVIFMVICRILQRNDEGIAMLLAVLPGIVLLFIAWATGETIGFGDGMSVLLLGGMTGFRNCIWVLCISLMLLSAIAVLLLALKKAGRKTKIPYLPFLFVAEGIFVIFII